MLTLRCPHCGQPLIASPAGFDCENRHHFDRARQGYVNLYISQKQNHGDDALMVQSRHRFLQAGYYEPLLMALLTEINTLQPDNIVDLGCGEGYYTRALRQPTLAIDLSKEALRYLRPTPTLQPVLASISQIPLFDKSADLVLNLFSPLYPDEIERILAPNGHVITVQVGVNHLLELKQALYPEVLLNPEPQNPFVNLERIHSQTVEFNLHLEQAALSDLIDMTPYTYRTPKAAIERVKALSTLDVRCSFVIHHYGTPS